MLGLVGKYMNVPLNIHFCLSHSIEAMRGSKAMLLDSCFRERMDELNRHLVLLLLSLMVLPDAWSGFAGGLRRGERLVDFAWLQVCQRRMLQDRASPRVGILCLPGDILHQCAGRCYRPSHSKTSTRHAAGGQLVSQPFSL